MTFAFEVSKTDLAEEYRASLVGRSSQDKIAFRNLGVFLKRLGLDGSESFLRPIADNFQQYKAYILNPDNGYTPQPTAEEIAQAVKQKALSYEARLNDAVKAARAKHGADLPFQAMAYRKKQDDAEAWTTGKAPDTVKAVSERMGITDKQAKQVIIQASNQMRDLLQKTESVRDRAKGHIDRGEYDQADTLINLLGNF